MTCIKQRAADAIEQAIIQGYYDTEDKGARFMCVALSRMWAKGVIDHEVYKAAHEAINTYMQGRGVMWLYVHDKDIVFDLTDSYMYRIFCCNHFWRIIRILRGQPPLEAGQ